jgi:UDP-N-acetylglucosamine 1-carboxyvinyltransferase
MIRGSSRLIGHMLPTDVAEEVDSKIMRSIIIRGGTPLHGEVVVEGAKNSALKLMAAALLAPGVTRIRNVPDISDVETMGEVISGLGAVVSRSDHALEIDTTDITSFEAPYEIVARMRASISVLGPLVARLGQARVAMPGGCNIGSRKIDMHIRGLEALGVVVETGHGYIHATAPDGLIGADVTLDFPSVGATENLLMAAVRAKGRTIIKNAAREPEIQDLAIFLRGMGAHIEGEGSPIITIEGVDHLNPVDHRVVGDRVEAGTFLVAGAITGGAISVRGFDPRHMDMVLGKLEQAGCAIKRHEDGISIACTDRPRAVDIQTLPHPGYPTDMQAQHMALMAIAQGDCVITENVFENRFMFADELTRMGADVRIEGHHALIKGVKQLSGAPVRSPDLRGGAALVLAGLVAEGTTHVGDVYHIERGYERFVEKLRALGADVRIDGVSEAHDANGC